MDSLDRQLIHALFVDGRASFSRIAEVLDVSDQTIARRYQQLRETGALHVIGRLDPARLGQVEWMVRLQCTPGASSAIAEALAKRDDTHWVRLASGGTEVVCTVQADSEQSRDALLLSKLPATRSVTAVSAHCLLHIFRGGSSNWPAATSALTEQQVAALAEKSEAQQPKSDAQPAKHEKQKLDANDRALLAELARDGRATHAALAAATGQHEAAIRRRITLLRNNGVLYFDVDIDNRLLGYTGTALLWISVEPARLTAVGWELARHHEIAFVAATTGATNLLASVVCRDVHALYQYLAGRVGSLPGIREIETAPVLRTVKRAGANLLPASVAI